MKYVDKIIFRDKNYNKLYQGSDLLFEVNRELDYLNFTALEPSTIKYTPFTKSTAQYSYDKVNWETADNVTLNLNKGDKVYFRGNITNHQGYNNCANFKMTGKVSASGSIMSLQAGNPEDNSINYIGEFNYMFENCTSLVSAPKLPATTLTQDCYCGMFSGCKSLKTAPSLPATTLANHCYSHMFENCTSLINATELSATTLAERCCSFMFDGCTSLVKAPELKATTLVDYCYASMFSGCTSLEKAPVLTATTLGMSSYSGMFENCVNLKYIKCDVDYYIYYCFDNWLKNVSHTGDFYCYDASIFPIGVNGIPDGWTVHSEI